MFTMCCLGIVAALSFTKQSAWKRKRGRCVSECMFKGIGSINEHCFGRLTKEKKETGWLITRKDVIIAELNVNISELSTT